MRIDDLLLKARELGASDLHITVEQPPIVRVNGELVRLPGQNLKAADTRELLDQLMGESQRESFDEQGEVDFSYGLPGIGRFRVNGFRQRGAAAISIRLISAKVPTMRELNLPEALDALARLERGLVLVTGPTGSGKSTTLAAMVNLINEERACHVLTLEDPIEYLHRHNKAVINQREVGQDTKSFANGLRAALREDPDVILVGEMRDLETTSIAVSAAETGHLVFATMHTPSAAETVNRIIDIFPPFQQQQIRIQLANVLEGIVAMRLLPRADGKGRVAAFEILIATPAVRNLVREEKTHQIPSSIQTGARYGMVTMEQYLRQLHQQGLISKQTMDENLPDSLIPGAV